MHLASASLPVSNLRKIILAGAASGAIRPLAFLPWETCPHATGILKHNVYEESLCNTDPDCLAPKDGSRAELAAASQAAARACWGVARNQGGRFRPENLALKTNLPRTFAAESTGDCHGLGRGFLLELARQAELG